MKDIFTDEMLAELRADLDGDPQGLTKLEGCIRHHQEKLLELIVAPYRFAPGAIDDFCSDLERLNALRDMVKARAS